ncbi:MAG: isoprenylcysteine carboxylmethyltransferase family protein [Bacteroidia bacterium]
MIILISLWLGFYCMHSLLASSRVKEWAAQRTGRFYRYYRLGYNVISLAGFGAIVWIQVFIPDIELSPRYPWLFFGGIIVMVSGMVTGYIAFSQYDSGEFFGFNQTQQHEPPKLVTTGLNQYVRHPLYFATILILTGYLMISFTANTMIFVVISFLYLIVGTILEEQKLEKIFGEAYKTYKHKVKMFIPFII